MDVDLFFQPAHCKIQNSFYFCFSTCEIEHLKLMTDVPESHFYQQGT